MTVADGSFRMYFDAPPDKPLEHELTVWLNHNEIIGFNTASLAPAANYYKKKRAMEFTVIKSAKKFKKIFKDVLDG